MLRSSGFRATSFRGSSPTAGRRTQLLDLATACAVGTGLTATVLTMVSDNVLQTTGQLVVKLACCVLVLLGVQRYRPAEPFIWYALAAYFALTGLRNLSRVVAAATSGWTPLSGNAWEISLNITSGIFLAAASIRVLHQRGRLQRWSLADAWVLGVAVALAAFILAVLPVLAANGPDVTFWNAVVVTVVRDTLVLIPVIAIWYSESIQLPALKAWCTGFSVMMVADLVHLIGGAAHASFAAAVPVVLGIGLGQLLLAGSASLPSMQQITAPAESARPPWHLQRTVVMGVAALLPVAAVIAGHPLHAAEVPAVMGGFGVLVSVLLWRMRKAVVDANNSINVATRLAHHDTLTGLNNGRYLGSVLPARYDHRVRTGQEIAVACCYLDVDELKHVNDRFQHAVGDELLQSLATSLSKLPDAEVMRVGGDEFIVLAELTGGSTDRAEQAALLADQVDRLGNPADDPADGTQHRVSIGTSWTVLRRSDISVDHQLQNVVHEADLAQVEAKRAGGHQVVSFRPSMSDRARRRQLIAASVKNAWELGEMSLAFQPVVAARTGQIFGVESLLRWQHDGLGAVAPDEAIEIAVHTGRILDLGLDILGSALVRAEELPAGQRIGVNLSAPQLRPAAIDSLIATILTSGQADRLWLEVTEQMLVEERSYVAGALNDLRSVGVMVAVDDFGTGYCGLDYLCTIPVDIVKLDKVFAAEISSSHTRRRVARLGVQLADSIGAATLAEGVENDDTAMIMRDLGCAYLQGYALRRPGFDLSVAVAPIPSYRRRTAVSAEVG